MVAAIDGGPNWDADTSAAPHATLADPGSNDNAAFPALNPGPTVPSTTPGAVFDDERWDAEGGTEMQWEFPVTAGMQVQVRLYMGNGYPGTSAPGQRVFDVQIDGVTVIDNRDLSATYGHEVGAMEAFTIVSDGTIDIDFIHGVENPLINAIEIVSATPQPNMLGVAPAALDFGNVETGTTNPKLLTLTNLGGPGDPVITIGVVTASGEFTAAAPLDTTLDPGQSTTLEVSSAPTTVGPKSGTLTINHSGTNTPKTVPLSADAFAPGGAPVGFSFSNLGGESSSNPTTLQFGPDDRLYVGQQNGTIIAYTIARNGPDDYDVTATETILDVKSIPNHDDNGAVNAGQTDRQLTGLLVTGTSTNPVIYATSSDPRIGAGGGPDVNLDTNSGVLSRLTWNGSDWVHVQLVRGLPRSEENHSSNGLALSADGNTIYIAQGGHTNQGAPSNNFAFLPEYALSGAILSVNLTAIGSTTYDIPTIGTHPTAPFGGNDGLNQAKLVTGGPVQVHSPGWRNPYDVLLTEDGQMYSIDNGPNGGWGAVPVGEGTSTCTNATAEPGSTHIDNLHYISGPGYYAGHPNPTRGNKANTFPAVGGVSPVEPAANSVECDYRTPGTEDGALELFGASTNGLTEYTATNFGGQMVGDILTASFSDEIFRIQLTADGTGIQAPKQSLFSGFGSVPLDVTAQGDGDIFPGTVWSANYGSGTITVFEPDDFGGPPPGCTGADNPLLDEDGDLFDNADEIDNGTNPCSAASQPPDFDGDKDSNLNDPDDDQDTIPDTTDKFAIDPANGTTTVLPLNFTWENDGTPEGGLLNTGFTGLMTNGIADYGTLYDPTNMTVGGAGGVTTIDLVPDGDAVGGENSQAYGFQVGINVGGQMAPFTASTRIVAPFAGLTPENFQSMGLFIGTGDQSNYVKLVTSANGGPGGIEFAWEVMDVFNNRPQPSVPMPGPDYVDLFLTIDPVANTVQPAYQVTTGGTTGPLTALGGPEPIPSTWLDGVLAVGLISTSFGDGDPFPAQWDFLSVTQDPAPTGTVLYRVNAGGPLVAGTNGPNWEADTLADPSEYWVANGANVFTSTGGNGTGQVMTGPLGVPLALFDDERFDFPTGDPGELLYSFPVAAGAVVDVKVYLAEIYDGITGNGQRVFDIEVEGSVPPAFDNLDPFALAGGVSKGTVVTASGITVGSDGSLDLEFLHDVIENPNPKAIEIILTTPAPAGLVANPTSLAFGTVTTGETSTPQLVTFTNPIGTSGPVEITSLSTSPGFASTPPPGPWILDPGESLNVSVQFAPTVSGPAIGSLSAQHDGAGSPLSVALSGTGEDPAPTGTVLYRVNSGGPEVTAATGPDWEADTPADPSAYWVVNGENVFNSNVGPVTTGPPGVPLELFNDERYDDLNDAGELLYSFPLAAGAVVTVNVYIAEIYSGVDSAGDRVFDIAVEGSVPPAFNDVDPFALAGGAAKGTVVTATGITVLPDGSLDIEFQHDVIENPNPKAIEIILTTPAPAGLVASPTSLTFGPTTTGETSAPQLVTITNPLGTSGPVQITGLATTDPTFAIDSGPTLPAILNPGESTTVGVDFTPTADGLFAGTLDVTHDGAGSPLSVTLSGTGEDPAPVNTPPTCTNGMTTATSGVLLMGSVDCSDADVGDTLTYSVVDDVDHGTLALNPNNGSFSYTSTGGYAGPDSFTFKANDGTVDSNVATFSITVNLAPGTILYRINAGGPEVPAVGGGPNWAQDTTGSPSLLHDGGSNTGGFPWVSGAPDGTVPSTTPSEIFTTERWDPGLPNMEWNFPVPSATSLEVRLFFRNGYDGTNDAGERVFDVVLEGTTVLDDFDLSGSVGHDIGTMRSFIVPSDGNIDLDFGRVTENPLINGIEIVVAGAPADDDLVYRINAGGSSIVLPAGPGWLADSPNPQGMTLQGGPNLFSTPDALTYDPSVPSDTPQAVFQTERWDDTANPEMSYSFAVADGEYQVRLYLAEIFITDNSGIPRVFDVQVEGSVPPEFDDIALFPTYGHDVGVMLSANVTMTDGTLDLVFVHVSENPNVKGIEIIKLVP
jgi:hypothetical protein